MTTAKPLARYSAVEGALASGFATAELHHLSGHDRAMSVSEQWRRSCGWLVQERNTRSPSSMKEAEKGVDDYG